MDGAVRLALGSIAVGAVVLALKLLAYRLTGSVALYSDALESTVNIAASVAALAAVAKAHDICDRIEEALKAEVGEALVTIHVEPEGKAKHSGIVVL